MVPSSPGTDRYPDTSVEVAMAIVLGSQYLVREGNGRRSVAAASECLVVAPSAPWPPRTSSERGSSTDGAFGRVEDEALLRYGWRDPTSHGCVSPHPSLPSLDRHGIVASQLGEDLRDREFNLGQPIQTFVGRTDEPSFVFAYGSPRLLARSLCQNLL